MKLNQPKVFKFLRKEYQTSEEVNPLKDQKMKIRKKEGRDGKSLSVQEERLRKNLVFFNFDGHHKNHDLQNSSLQTPEKRELKQPIKNKKDDNNKKKSVSIEFDKKLSKVMMPDSLQKIKFIKKLQNRLLSCLQKKKPHVYVKQLINEQTLNNIFGKNSRRLTTSNNYLEKLDIQAESVKKTETHKEPQNTKGNHEHKKKEKFHKNVKPKMKAAEFFNEEPQESYFQIFREPLMLEKQSNILNEEVRYSEDDTFFNLKDYEYEVVNEYSERQGQKREYERQPHKARMKPHKQRNKYDLRNLKVPKLDILQKEKSWNEPLFDTIRQVQQDAYDSDFLSNPGNLDQLSFFSNISFDQFEEHRQDDLPPSWKSESSFY